MLCSHKMSLLKKGMAKHRRRRQILNRPTETVAMSSYQPLTFFPGWLVNYLVSCRKQVINTASGKVCISLSVRELGKQHSLSVLCVCLQWSAVKAVWTVCRVRAAYIVNKSRGQNQRSHKLPCLELINSRVICLNKIFDQAWN